MSRLYLILALPSIMSCLAVFEQSPYTAEVATAFAAIVKASHVTDSVFKRFVRDRDFVLKGDRSPVTVGDYAAQAVVSCLLHARYPEYPLVGEEDSSDLLQESQSTILNAVLNAANDTLQTDTGDSVTETEWENAGFRASLAKKLPQDSWLAHIDRGNADRTDTGRAWALDPIDGTRGFLRRGQYAVCLSLLDKGEPVVGIIGCPNLPYPSKSASDSVLGSIVIAVKGCGAFQRSYKDPTLKRISFNDILPSNLENASFCESVDSVHSSQDTSAKVAELLGIQNEPVRMDSQAKYASICRGDGDIYLRIPDQKKYAEKIWDHACGAILVKEAGGIVTDVYGNPLDFSLGRTLENNRGIVAASKDIHAEVIKAVKASLK